jgi:Flp pilus assembly protein TadG
MTARKASRRPGHAAVEFAVLLPFLLFICVLATDWARLYYYTITVEACARNGALYASDQVTQNQSPYTSVQQAALAEAPALNGTATVTQTNSTDSTGAAVVVVTVSVPFKTIANFPGVPSSQTLSRSVQMQVAPNTTK